MKPIAKVARGGAADIDRAAKAAKKAFRPAGRQPPATSAAQLLHKIADAIVARADEIAFVECMDTGQPIRYMAKAALRGAENFRFFADRAPERATACRCRPRRSSTTPSASRSARSASSRPGTRRSCCRPGRSRRRSRPAAPSSTSRPNGRPLTARAAGRDLPRGRAAGRACSNLVHGLGEDAGKALTEHPDIKAIGFVGESRPAR